MVALAAQKADPLAGDKALVASGVQTHKKSAPSGAVGWCEEELKSSGTVMALVLPSVQRGGASTRTSLEITTNQIRGTHFLSV